MDEVVQQARIMQQKGLITTHELDEIGPGGASPTSRRTNTRSFIILAISIIRWPLSSIPLAKSAPIITNRCQLLSDYLAMPRNMSASSGERQRSSAAARRCGSGGCNGACPTKSGARGWPGAFEGGGDGGRLPYLPLQFSSAPSDDPITRVYART